MKRITALLFSTLALAFIVMACNNNLVASLDQKRIQSESFKLAPDSWLLGEPKPDITLPVPASILASQGSFSNKIKIEWSPVTYQGEDANYHVYRSEDGVTFTRLTSLEIPLKYNFYEDDKGDLASNVNEHKHYQYAIKAVFHNKTIFSRYSFLAQGYLLSRPKNISASFRKSESYVELKWDKGLGANSYEVEVSGPYPDSVTSSNIDGNLTQKLGQTFSVLKIFDYSTDYQGVRIPGKKYFYRVCSHYSSTVVSSWSRWVAGSILAPGAPAKPFQVNASKGIYSDFIEVKWKKDPFAAKYSVYMENSTTGDFTTVVAESATNSCKILAASLVNGGRYYFRISATNADGDSGPLSDLNGDFTSGYLLNPPTPYFVYGFSDSAKILGAWDKVVGADSGYKVWKAGPFSDLNAQTDPATVAPAYDQWTSVTDDFITDNYLDDSAVNENSWYLYKIKAINSGYATDNQFYDTEGATEPTDAKERIFSDLKQKGKSAAKFVLVSTAKTPPFALKSVIGSKKDVNNISGVSVKVITDKLLPIAFLQQYGQYIEFKIQKRSQHGDDPNLNPNTEPQHQGEALFRLKGTPIRTQLEQFDLSILKLASSNSLTWKDPMNDFNAAGGVSGKLSWDYRRWNREAWKDIIRKKPFDMERAVSAKYRSYVRWKNSDASWPKSETADDRGYPALSAKEFSLLIAFMRECAFNRFYILSWISQIEATSGNLLHLKNNPIYLKGEYGGTVSFIVESFDLLKSTGNGKGSLANYSDWGPKWSISLNTPGHSIAMALQSDTESFFNFPLIIKSPLYSGKANCLVKLLMGLYQRGVRGGSIEVKQDGRPTEYVDALILNSCRANPNLGRYNPVNSTNIVFGNYTTINFTYHYSKWQSVSYDIDNGSRFYGFY